MEVNEKRAQLADGTEVTVRVPDVEKDLDDLMEFFSNLPKQTRNYLRYDVTDRAICQSRLQQVDNRYHFRLIAELDGKIIGEGSLDREPYGWTRHVGHLRTVISPQFQTRGIRLILLSRLVELGSDVGIERFNSEVLAKHQEMVDGLKKAGFTLETIREDYAKDIRGELHDVLIMTIDAGSAWQTLQEQIDDMDIQASRILSSS